MSGFYASAADLGGTEEAEKEEEKDDDDPGAESAAGGVDGKSKEKEQGK